MSRHMVDRNADAVLYEGHCSLQEMGVKNSLR